MGMSKQKEEPAVGIPYTGGAYPYDAPMPQAMHEQYHGGQNPYQPGFVPPNALVGDPKGMPIHQTFFRDTPAPFHCTHCGDSALTNVRSKPSLAAAVGCMMPLMLGFCFLCPSMDCLWHKYHYCPNCNEKVADFEKSDICIVVDPPHWTQPSFALPA